MTNKLPIAHTQTGDPVLQLSLPIDLYFDLLAKAEEAGRPLQDEMALRLTQSLADEDQDMLSQPQLMRLIYGS